MFVDVLLLAKGVVRVRPAWQLRRISAAAAQAHFELLGSPSGAGPPALSTGKMTDWNTKQMVLGWELDTVRMTVALTAENQLQLVELPAGWLGLHRATVLQVQRLAGKLQRASYAVRGGKYFMRRLWGLLAGIPVHQAGAHWLTVPKDVQRDLDFWRWALGGRQCRVPIASLVERDADTQWLSDASYTAIGGYCPQYRIWWRYNITPEQDARLVRTNRMQQGQPHINAL